MKKIIFLLVLALAVLSIGQLFVKADNYKKPEMNKLAVVWTSGDPDVAHKMCLMYTHAAKTAKWFDEVVLVVWGPSSRLLAGDKELQTKIKNMQESGVIIQHV